MIRCGSRQKRVNYPFRVRETEIDCLPLATYSSNNNRSDQVAGRQNYICEHAFSVSTHLSQFDGV